MAKLSSQLQLSLLDRVTGPIKKVSGALSAFQRQTSSLMAPVLAIGAGYIGITQGLENTYNAAAKAQSAMTEIGIKAGLTGSQLDMMQKRLTGMSARTNQFTTDLTAGIDTMLTMGLGATEAMGSIEAVGKAATATGSSMTDLSSASVSAIQNAKVLPEQIAKMLDGMTEAGNAGAFEMRDMAQYFPALTAQAKSLGMTGVDSILDMAAALQIARRGAGDASTAANNMSNFLGKIMSPDVIKNFKKFGVDVTKELKKAHKQGISPIEHFIKLVDEKTNGGQADLLGKLFGDKQVLDFVRPMISDFKDYLAIRDQANRASGTVAEAYERRMMNAEERTKALRISLSNLGMSIGANLLEPVGRAADYLSDVFNTLDTRVTVFDRIKTPIDGFLSGLGSNDGIGKAANEWRDFIFGVKDGSAAADEVGRMFGKFRVYGEDFRSFVDAIRGNPVGEFITNLGLALAGMGLSKWFKLYAIASAIQAVADAARDAHSITEFVENLKGLSAMEWAGVAAGLLLIANRARSVVSWFKEINKAAPKAPEIGNAKPGSSGAKPPVPRTGEPPGWGPFNLRNLGRSLLNGGVNALIGWAGEKGIRSFFENATGKPFVEPPDLAGSIDNTWAAWKDQVSGVIQKPGPRGNYSPFSALQQQRDANAPVKIDTTGLDAIFRPRGTQDVRVTNPPPPPPAPNLNQVINFSVTSSADPKAIAGEAAQKLGGAVKAAVESSLTGNPSQ